MRGHEPDRVFVFIMGVAVSCVLVCEYRGIGENMKLIKICVIHGRVEVVSNQKYCPYCTDRSATLDEVKE